MLLRLLGAWLCYECWRNLRGLICLFPFQGSGETVWVTGTSLLGAECEKAWPVLHRPCYIYIVHFINGVITLGIVFPLNHQHKFKFFFLMFPLMAVGILWSLWLSSVSQTKNSISQWDFVNIIFISWILDVFCSVVWCMTDQMRRVESCSITLLTR